VILALQDVTQLGSEREAQSVLANCQTAITFTGCSHETAEFMQDRLGQRKVQKVGVNRRDLELLGGRNHAIEDVSVLGDREIMHIPVGHYPAIVHARGVSAKPFLVELDR
jgi:type IV secretory pathway TraG/TraD family ATPase VirD4